MLDCFASATFRRIAGLTLVLALVVSAFALSGCKKNVADDAGTTTEANGGPVEVTKLRLASTTSTQDSGLFDVLVPAFEDAYPEYDVDVIAVGTGEAIALGEAKDADVLLVHAKAKEETFVADGFGTERRDVMYNDFVIVGPAADPAGIKGGSAAAAAFTTISDSGAEFVSRGDESGTHTKEKAIWAEAGIEPAGAWYVSAGAGMGDVLKMASEKQAYTMADRATYLNLRETLDLEILVEGDTILFNQYGVIPVTDATNLDGANAFMEWVTGPEGQAVIETYGMEEFGQPLFVPNAQ